MAKVGGVSRSDDTVLSPRHDGNRGVDHVAGLSPPAKLTNCLCQRSRQIHHRDVAGAEKLSEIGLPRTVPPSLRQRSGGYDDRRAEFPRPLDEHGDATVAVVDANQGAGV